MTYFTKHNTLLVPSVLLHMTKFYFCGWMLEWRFLYVFLSSVEKNMKYIPADVSGKTKLRLGTNIKYYPLKKIIYLFIYYFWLCWVFVPAQAFSSCGVWRLLFIVVHRLFIMVASVAEHRFWGAQASVVMVCGLNSCGSQALEHRLSSCSSRAPEHRLSSCGSWVIEHRLQ